MNNEYAGLFSIHCGEKFLKIKIDSLYSSHTEDDDIAYPYPFLNGKAYFNSFIMALIHCYEKIFRKKVSIGKFPCICERKGLPLQNKNINNKIEYERECSISRVNE